MRAEFLIGWATADISPRLPVELCGQYYQRLAEIQRDPLTAVALALQAPAAGAAGQALLVGVDLTMVDKTLQDAVRARLAELIPDFAGANLLLHAIHTHTAPAPLVFRNWWQPHPQAMSCDAYRTLLVERIAKVAAEAWAKRAPGGISFARTWAVTGHCRRPVYASGTAEMYGAVDRPDFVGMEGGEDGGVELLFTWDLQKRLTGALVNAACPAQVLEAKRFVSADFVGEMRRMLAQAWGESLPIIYQVAPAGDLSPRDLTRNYRGSAAHFWDEAGAQIIARRLMAAVLEAVPEPLYSVNTATSAIDWAPMCRHVVQPLPLPLRRVTEAEQQAARLALDKLLAEDADLADMRQAYRGFEARTLAREQHGGPGPYDDKGENFVRWHDYQAVLNRYQEQNVSPHYQCELHVLRLGIAVMASNPFELFLEYAQRMRAHAPADYTFLVQLAADYGGYLPTRAAVAHGGYGALVINGKVGPDGGDILTEKTIALCQQLFA